MNQVKTYKQQAVPAYDKMMFDKLTCDLCGAKAHSEYQWDNGICDVSETTIKYRHGESWPEGGSDTTISVDICPSCFKNKLIPWLESQNVSIREEDSDW